MPQRDNCGVSMMYTFDKANENAPTTHTTQYFEMFGDRALYHDGWIAGTKVMRPPWIAIGPTRNVLDYPWELYDLKNDWTQFEDVAAKYQFLRSVRNGACVPCGNEAIATRPWK